MQTGQVNRRKVNVIELEGNNNAENPLRITEDPLDTVFQVREEFGLYTEGTLTKRGYFGKLCRGTHQAYEVQTPEGQRNVIVQRVY